MSIEAALFNEKNFTYRTVQHIGALVTPFFDMAFESARVKWLEQLEATEELRRHRHDGSPVVKFATILDFISNACIGEGG